MKTILITLLLSLFISTAFASGEYEIYLPTIGWVDKEKANTYLWNQYQTDLDDFRDTQALNHRLRNIELEQQKQRDYRHAN